MLLHDLEASPATGGSYQGWALNPMTISTLADTFNDLEPVIAQDAHLAWMGIAPFFRLTAAVYSGRIVGLPYTNDVFSLFYRRDILATAGLPMPSTWDELLVTAQLLNGSDFDQDGLPEYGFCFPHTPTCPYTAFALAAVWAPHIVATGRPMGLFFDSPTMRPLTGTAAMADALTIIRRLKALAAPSDATQACNGQSDAFAAGRCVFTVAPTIAFKHSLVARNGTLRGKIGTAMMPGSPEVLNRQTGAMERCTKEICPYAELLTGLVDPDATLAAATAAAAAAPPGNGSGFAAAAAVLAAAPRAWQWVNRAPFLGNGALSAGVNKLASPAEQLAVYEAFVWAIDPEVLWPRVLRVNALRAQPTRREHFDPANLGRWVAAGYHVDDIREHLAVVSAAIEHPNALLTLRLPGSVQVVQAMQAAVMSAVSTSRPIAEIMARLTDRVYDVYDNFSDPKEFAYLRNTYYMLQGYLPTASPPPEPAASAPSGSPSTTTILIATLVPCLGLAGLVLVGLGLLSYVRPAWLPWRLRLRRGGSGAPPGYGPLSTVVVTDLQDSTPLWEALDPLVMQEAMRLHDGIVRRWAFHTPQAAAAWALETQAQLLTAPWPEALLAHPSAAVVTLRDVMELAEARRAKIVEELAAAASCASFLAPTCSGASLRSNATRSLGLQGLQLLAMGPSGGSYQDLASSLSAVTGLAHVDATTLTAAAGGGNGFGVGSVRAATCTAIPVGGTRPSGGGVTAPDGCGGAAGFCDRSLVMPLRASTANALAPFGASGRGGSSSGGGRDFDGGGGGGCDGRISGVQAYGDGGGGGEITVVRSVGVMQRRSAEMPRDANTPPPSDATPTVTDAVRMGSVTPEVASPQNSSLLPAGLVAPAGCEDACAAAASSFGAETQPAPENGPGIGTASPELSRLCSAAPPPPESPLPATALRGTSSAASELRSPSPSGFAASAAALGPGGPVNANFVTSTSMQALTQPVPSLCSESANQSSTTLPHLTADVLMHNSPGMRGAMARVLSKAGLPPQPPIYGYGSLRSKLRVGSATGMLGGGASLVSEEPPLRPISGQLLPAPLSPTATSVVSTMYNRPPEPYGYAVLAAMLGGGAAGIRSSRSDHVLFRGLRMRMGIVLGIGEGSTVSVCGVRATYGGSCVNTAKAVADAGQGGMVLLTAPAAAELAARPSPATESALYWQEGTHALKNLEAEETTLMLSGELQGRLPYNMLRHGRQLRSGTQLAPGLTGAPVGTVLVAHLTGCGLANLFAWDKALASAALEQLWAVASRLAAESGGCAFRCHHGCGAAFTDATGAVQWGVKCVATLREHEEWSPELLKHELCEPLYLGGALVQRGLRVKVAVHVGPVRPDPGVGSCEGLYLGVRSRALAPVLEQLTAVGKSGWVVCSHAAASLYLSADKSNRNQNQIQNPVQVQNQIHVHNAQTPPARTGSRLSGLVTGNSGGTAAAASAAWTAAASPRAAAAGPGFSAGAFGLQPVVSAPASAAAEITALDSIARSNDGGPGGPSGPFGGTAGSAGGSGGSGVAAVAAAVFTALGASGSAAVAPAPTASAGGAPAGSCPAGGSPRAGGRAAEGRRTVALDSPFRSAAAAAAPFSANPNPCPNASGLWPVVFIPFKGEGRLAARSAAFGIGAGGGGVGGIGGVPAAPMYIAVLGRSA
ncbi:hypothetical protein HYH03_001075 [Edaphochlamys debaryana]|uniref:Guanylate cyclase domain-containing protein n=1 Tax=Edaphochlamys debaryana TaxID=47281 RepID=A0A835YGE2_9CHLO|nr:hypothetical protein HYH03_001075 [Edaphochlamys debaryana]|eukprot:KAG2501269.1 hypothetical protein HYH03_001075 [Edaphochlamys debaryana]